MTAWTIVGAIAISNVGAWVFLAVGVIKNRTGAEWWKSLKKPWCNPPDPLLAVIWTTWYTCMGYASYLVYEECGGFTERATLPLTVYGVHLLVNWTWTPVFIRTKSLMAGLVHIVALDAAVIATVATFIPVTLTSLYPMLPYMCWMVFDTSLMIKVWMDNNNEDILKRLKDDK